MFRQPLVSIIIVNYNYGHFLEDAVLSAYNQTYQNTECIVIDNNSDDNSAAVLDDLVKAHPDLKVVFRDQNEGQCIASAEAFVKTHGQYVVFLDADDVLLPDFVSTHVYVNLSLYIHVGFTFADMMQVVDNQIVVSTSRTQRPDCPAEARPLLRPFAFDGGDVSVPARVEEAEVLLIEKSQKDWCWTATSAFMFRRDAVDLFIRNPRLRYLQCAFDVYLARGINAITGSVAINRALCVYRMHSANIFSRHAQLERCHNYEAGGTNDQSEQARREIIDYIFLNLPAFKKKITQTDDVIDIVRTIDGAMPRLPSQNARYVTHGAARLLETIDEVSRLYGKWRALKWCLKLGVPLRGAARIATGFRSTKERRAT